MAKLLSVNVGMPKDVAWQDKTVHTGAWKAPVDGPQMVRRLNIEGDGQGDLGGHGGEIRAVLVYQLDSYRYWREHLDRDDLSFGNFGENFTVDGLPDDDVCIGDRYRIGEAEFEVTQPRVTCYRVGMRLGEPTMASLLVAHHRPGFYLRVIAEGHVEAGDEITLTRRGPEELSVADTDALLYLPDRDPDRLRKALNIPALSPGWQQSFRELADAQHDGAQPGSGGGAKAAEPGWPGFKTMRVDRIVHETPAVASVYLVTTDGTPLPESRPGQYLSLRVAVGDAAPAVRSYSLSHVPTADTYRISVKHEPHGQVSGYIHATLRTGDLVDVASPRGAFVLEEGDRPVVLISAGIGATPMLAMLQQLAAGEDPRPVWWIHTAHDRAHHAFAEESAALLARLPDAHEHIYYTAKDAPSRTASRSAGAARPARRWRESGCRRTPTPTSAGRPPSWTASAATCATRASRPSASTPRSSARCPPSTPASRPSRRSGRTSRRTSPARGRSSPSPAAASPPGGPAASRRCWTWRTPATCPPAGPAVRASATPASPAWCRVTSPTPHRRWSLRRTARC